MSAANHRVAALYDRSINPTGMYSVPELVTKEMADAYLATMPKQRNIRRNRVSAYAKQRREGKWCLHHQGIGFDTDGRLRDGQHRLTMISETGMATILWVSRNVPVESFLHVDESLPRSAPDALRMADRGDHSNSATALARVIVVYPAAEGSAAVMDKNLIAERLETWAPEIRFCEDHCRGTRLSRGVRAVVARALAARGKDIETRLMQWCQILREGTTKDGVSPGDVAAVTYRNFLEKLRGGGSAPETDRYRRGQNMLYSFLRGDRTTKCYSTESDLFPVPPHKADKATNDQE